MKDIGKPKISVMVLTYQHENFIESALKGALNQQTAFPYEIVVAEDHSTDRTLGIVKQLEAEHSGRMRVLARPHNLGICRNFTDAYSRCEGEYIAILEGDDIWDCPYKLQQLSEVLDADPNCSFAFHNVKLLFEDGRRQESCCPSDLRPRLTIHDFVAENPVPNCSSLMFRNRLIRRFPGWFQNLAYYDWPLHVLHLEHGDARYISEPLSTYRIHGKSAWHGATDGYRLEKLLEIFDRLDEHLDFQYTATLNLNKRYWWKHTEANHLRQRVEQLEKSNARSPRKTWRDLVSPLKGPIRSLINTLRRRSFLPT